MADKEIFLARIAALESDKVRRRQQTEDEASDRLWRVLDAGLLPDAPPYRAGDLGRSERELLALDDRLASNTAADHDHDLLARLPADSLAVWAGGIDARGFIATFAQVYRDF